MGQSDCDLDEIIICYIFNVTSSVQNYQNSLALNYILKNGFFFKNWNTCPTRQTNRKQGQNRKYAHETRLIWTRLMRVKSPAASEEDCSLRNYKFAPFLTLCWNWSLGSTFHFLLLLCSYSQRIRDRQNEALTQENKVSPSDFFISGKKLCCHCLFFFLNLDSCYRNIFEV